MANSIISVYNFLNNETITERIDKDEGVVYAEDLIHKITRDNFEVNPIGVNLFALYHPKAKIWLCPNQTLKSLQDDAKLPDLNFQLKVRFLPTIPIELYRCDRKTFDYYFYQTRTDFMAFPRNKFNDGFESEVYGIALQDKLRLVIESKITTDEIKNNIKKIVDEIYKLLPKNMPRQIFEAFFPIKSKLEESFIDSYCKNHNVNYVKSCYINQYVRNLACNYYDENYKVGYFNPKHRFPLQKIMTFQVLNQTICLKSNKTDSWEPQFTLKEVMYITVLDDNLTIQISHFIGAPVSFTFENNLKMKSFVALLSGYYRLSLKWNFEICTKLFSPWMDTMRKINCHGPVSSEFVIEKLHKFCDEGSNHNPFIFHQSKEDFTIFYITFKDKKYYTVECDLRKATIDFYLKDFDQHFISHHTLFEYIRKIHHPASPLYPSESDMPLNLLLCKIKEDPVKKENNRELTVVFNDQVEKSMGVKTKNSLFCIRYGEIKKDSQKVMIKEFVNNNNVGQYLREISDWIQLQDSSIVNCNALIMNPYSVLFEFCQTSLQELYNDHKEGLPTSQLIQAAYFLAKSLDFIYSKDFRHGFIRFENLYVSHFSKKTLQIKLGDPIGYLNLNTESNYKDRPFFPPEYFESSAIFNRQITSYVDVWAFGTTLWQIFNKGIRPDPSPRQFNIRTQVHGNLVDIPPEIVTLIEECQHTDYSRRMQPCSIFGNMSRILSTTYEDISHFQTAEPMPQLNHNHNPYYNSNPKRPKEKSTLFSKLSISSFSLNSGQTDVTSLNQNDDAISAIYSTFSSSNLFELEKIVGNQLKDFRGIGEGHYGFVYKATLEKLGQITTVAVKVITGSESKGLDNEMGIMAKLKHKNIVQIIGYSYIDKITNDINNPKLPNGKLKGLVMEFLPLGSLKEYLKNKLEHNIRDVPLIKFAIDIAEGMAFLSSKNIIHRDLAARNILVNSEEEVKISDFGLSHIVENDYYKSKSMREIPIQWYAPESIGRNQFKTKSDVWSYGVLLWELFSFCKTDPFDDIVSLSHLYDYLMRGKRLIKPPLCPQPIYSIMEKCWQWEVDARPDFETILDELEELNLSKLKFPPDDVYQQL